MTATECVVKIDGVLYFRDSDVAIARLFNYLLANKTIKEFVADYPAVKYEYVGTIVAAAARLINDILFISTTDEQTNPARDRPGV